MSDVESIRPHIRLTVGDIIRSLGLDCGPSASGPDSYEAFRWPPDVFAVAATLLRDSGAYLQATREHRYPADSEFQITRWRSRIHRIGREWRARDCFTEDPPDYVKQLIDILMSYSEKELFRLSIPGPDNLSWVPVLQLLAIADEACRGIGILLPEEPKLDYDFETPDPYPKGNMVLYRAMLQLKEQLRSLRQDEYCPITLCRKVDPTRAIVLPKMRTSQRGATIRSFSFHLALLNGTDVEPVWNPIHSTLLPGGSRTECRRDIALAKIKSDAGPYNIILLPWPFEISPSQFRSIDVPLESLGGRPPTKNGMFSFRHEDDEKKIKGSTPSKGITAQNIAELVEAANKRVGCVHGLVLPEMALTRDRFNHAFRVSDGRGELPAGLEFVACGVYEPPQQPGHLGRNYVGILRRDGTGGGGQSAIVVEQEKHHRWALDPSQVSMYSLGSSLRTDTTWWEAIEVRRRRLSFFGLDALVAFTVLVCEDLARPDPVADAVRAVGPNLVICILMDGPQLRLSRP